MAKVDNYIAGREDGLQLALKLAEKGSEGTGR